MKKPSRASKGWVLWKEITECQESDTNYAPQPKKKKKSLIRYVSGSLGVEIGFWLEGKPVSGRKVEDWRVCGGRAPAGLYSGQYLRLLELDLKDSSPKMSFWERPLWPFPFLVSFISQRVTKMIKSL